MRLLLGLCCFLPSVLAAFPGALSLLLLLASACFLPPRPCSHLGLHCPLLSLCVVLCVVCCPFCIFCGFLVCFCPVLLVRSSRCVVVFVCCAWCQLTEVTKDCRRPPAQHHTHTHTVTSSSPRVSVGGWFISEFVSLLSWLSCCLVLWHFCLVLYGSRI